jgi:hypothetical protein
MYGQTVPKPFCNEAGDYVYVEGPVTFVESARLEQNGTYTSDFRGSGRLKVTPVNPLTGQPSGTPYFAEVSEQHQSQLGDDHQSISSDKRQLLVPESAPGRGMLRSTLDVDSRGQASDQLVIRCSK